MCKAPLNTNKKKFVNVKWIHLIVSFFNFKKDVIIIAKIKNPVLKTLVITNIPKQAPIDFQESSRPAQFIIKICASSLNDFGIATERAASIFASSDIISSKASDRHCRRRRINPTFPTPHRQ